MTPYTELAQVKRKLKGQGELKPEIEKYWKSLGLTANLDFAKPTAVVAKPAMFRGESALAIHMAEQADLGMAWLTYDDDKFISESRIKLSFAKPHLTAKFNKNGNYVTRKVTMVTDVQSSHRRKMGDLVTKDATSLVDWHKQRLLTVKPDIYLADMSEWSSKLGGNAQGYYEGYLSQFIAHNAVLFEDYHGGESGEALTPFTEGVFLPALEKIKKRFCASPVVVKLPWKPHYAFHPEGELLSNWRKEVLPTL